MTTVDTSAAANGVCWEAASRELAKVLDAQASSRAQATSAATRQLVERLRGAPALAEFRNDLEDALVDVAAHAVQALIKLREQRESESVDVASVGENLDIASTALRAAELTTAVLRSATVAS